MGKAERLFQIIEILRAAKMITAGELATHLGISVRTVYRDIHALKIAGISIRGEAGVGYRLSNTALCPPAQLTTGEFDALLLGARLVQRSASQAYGEAANTALSKIQRHHMLKR